MSSLSPASPPSHKNTTKPLPEGWKWVKLGEIAEQIDYGYTASADSKIDSPKFLRITDIQNGTVNWAIVPGCLIDSSTVNEYQLFNGDIVFARTGATTGKSYQIKDPPKSIFASYLIRVKVNQSYVLSDYLYQYFQSDGYWKLINSGMRGGALVGFNASMLKALDLPLPPLPEQKRIAAILKEQLTAIDKARKAAEERLAAVKALPAAFLRRVFPHPGQPLPEGWKWVKLGDISFLISKGTTPTSLGQKYTDYGIPFLRAEDVNGWEIEVNKIPLHISQETDEILSRSQLQPGDFVITIAGTLGRVGYIPHNASYVNCNQAVAFARIDKSKVDVQFLCLVCRDEFVIARLLELKMGGALQNLNLQQIRQFELPLPPLPEQKRIAAILMEQIAGAERARIAAEGELATINSLPAAILRKAFNGEI